jgi:thiamine pyrophosphate-dependent acetolactate synthase large subunit-like protein
MQLANPGRPVALLSGDGSFGFYIAELDTAMRHNLPVVFIIGNDAGWGLEREFQRAGTGRMDTVACELRATRYDVVMQGFGGEGETVRILAEVQPAVRRAFASGRPYVLNVEIQGTRSPFSEWQIAGKWQARQSPHHFRRHSKYTGTPAAMTARPMSDGPGRWKSVFSMNAPPTRMKARVVYG